MQAQRQSQFLDKKNMDKRIIFPNETGISVITPSGDLTVEETALKIVPSGVKFKILNVSDFPENRDFRNAWQFDFSSDFDGVGP